MPFTSTNPATGEVIRTFADLDNAQLEERLARADSAFRSWRTTPIEGRAVILARAAELLEQEKQELASLMTREMGKSIGAAVAEAEKCALACRYYAENAGRFLADEVVPTEASDARVRFEPIGAVLAVMPWNFPFWQVFRFAAPSLAAGNVGLLKHAANVPQCALAIEELWVRAGLPSGVFQTLLIGSDRVAAVIDDPRVKAVTLTGSEGAGSSVAERAGKRIKKSVLELGGSDPFIVMPSADLEHAVANAVRSRTINNGQSCIAAKRYIIHQAVVDDFLPRFVAGMKNLRVGDPMDPATEVGPLATESTLRDVDEQVRESAASGARVLVGGRRLERPGFYYAPTVLGDVPRQSPAYRDEVFGPVASVFTVGDVDEAIAIANDSRFGLGASVWTHDESEALELVERIEAGLVFVNAMVASDPRLPFGGVKNSGFGRELGSYGIREFVNVKTVWRA